MIIENKKVEDLIPYGRNQKKHDDRQISNVANSLRRFGWRQPIVIDKNGVVVIGHCRLLAAKKLGMSEVPVTVADDLSEDEIRELRIADNKTNESEWLTEFLVDDLEELGFEGFDFDFKGVSQMSGDEAQEDDYEVNVPETPRTKLGDLWQCGRHRLLVGDSTMLHDVETLMGGQKADLLLTDPPYNVALSMSGSAESESKRHRRTDGLFIMNDKMDDEKFLQFLTDAFSNARSVMKAGASFYIWHADNQGLAFRQACVDSGFKTRQTLIWNKSALTLGRQDYQWKHEPCLYGWVDADPEPGCDYKTEHEPCLYGWNDGSSHSWYADRKQTTILNFERPSKSKEHPTIKPIPLFDYQIHNSSKAGDIVLDLFGGSGTTMICCEQDGRCGYLMELDPHYADVIIDRWESLTSQKAVLLNG